MKPDDFQYAIENTQVILAPERKIATFGSTKPQAPTSNEIPSINNQSEGVAS